jgi:hypothetical protein
MMKAAVRMPLHQNNPSRVHEAWKPSALKVWTCIDHDSYSPLGAASVVVAATEEEARPLLREALRQRGIVDTDAYTLQELDLSQPTAVVLVDGN